MTQYSAEHPAGQPENDDQAQDLLDRLYRERFPGMRVRRTPRVHRDDDVEVTRGQATARRPHATA